MTFLTRRWSVERINRLRNLMLPGSLPLGQELLRSLSTAVRHSFLAGCGVFLALGFLNLDRPALPGLITLACFYIGVSLANVWQVERALRENSSLELVQSAFLRSFVVHTVLALVLALCPWLTGSTLSAYAELLTTLIVIAYSLIFAVMHSVFPWSVLSFGLINGVSVAAYWINTHYDFKWPMAALTLVFFGFLFVVTFNFGRILRRALSLQIERDQARLGAEDAARSLESALTSLKQASVEKLRLFAAANHDLRQPISAISLFVGVLQRKLQRRLGDDVEIKELIEKLDRNLSTLDVIVGSMSDITALETGDFAPRAEVFELSVLIQQLCQEFEGQCQASGTNIQSQLPVLSLFTDPRMVSRIVRSAVDNAVKFAGARPIIVSTVDRAGATFLSIRGFGPGIPDDLRHQVVGDYVQLDNPGRDRKKGYGVGLSIAKRLADALGSHIELHRPEGGGLELLLELTSLIASQPTMESTKVWAHSPGFNEVGSLRRSLKIVVVEDDDDVRAGLEALFETWGQEVRGFANIEATTLHLASLGPAQQPDHILVDNWLPDGRGLDAVADFRGLSPHACLTLLTGDSDAKTTSRARELDITVLLKPVTAERLGRLLFT